MWIGPLIFNSMIQWNKGGPIHKVSKEVTSIIEGNKIRTGRVVRNCGIRSECGNDEFPIHVYSGNDGVDICVDGK